MKMNDESINQWNQSVKIGRKVHFRASSMDIFFQATFILLTSEVCTTFFSLLIFPFKMQFSKIILQVSKILVVGTLKLKLIARVFISVCTKTDSISEIHCYGHQIARITSFVSVTIKERHLSEVVQRARKWFMSQRYQALNLSSHQKPSIAFKIVQVFITF